MRLRRVDTSKFDAEDAADDAAGVFGLPFEREDCSVVLIPVPWEVTTSYGRGTARGPAAIRQASAQLDFYDAGLAEQGLARPWEFGIHMVAENPEVARWNTRGCEDALPIIAAGGDVGSDPDLAARLQQVNARSRQLDEWVREEVDRYRADGHLVGVVGGDHSVALGAIEAHAGAHPGLGILHIDAHADLRRAYEGFDRSHASVMHNVLERCPTVEALVQVGIRDVAASEAERIRDDHRIYGHFDGDLRRRVHDGEPWSQICDEIVDRLPEHVYVSFDIDGLDPALCPGTGTPVPGGLDFGQVQTLLEKLVERNRRIVGFDLVEVAPRPDDEWDGNVGARILYRLCALSLYSQGARDGSSDG
jgi:agmatinase